MATSNVVSPKYEKIACSVLDIDAWVALKFSLTCYPTFYDNILNIVEELSVM